MRVRARARACKLVSVHTSVYWYVLTVCNLVIIIIINILIINNIIIIIIIINTIIIKIIIILIIIIIIIIITIIFIVTIVRIINYNDCVLYCYCHINKGIIHTIIMITIV